ncbi:MAG: glycosyltransferase, partial [Burkholderiales bacterium]
ESVDFILSGLPEKEALGLNLIEAQACGTPVIAIDAPPFDETVLDGVSGYLYTDPRKDDGAAFAALMQRILAGESRPRPLDAAAHLQRFSVAAFNQRVARALPTYNRELSKLGWTHDDRG